MSAKIKSIASPIKPSGEKKKGPDFKWLIGVWKNLSTENTFEAWKLDESNNLAGHGYKLIKGEKVISEYIKIITTKDGSFYESKLPQYEDSISFRILTNADFSFVCENPEYDFPKRISYELNGYDKLVSQIMGSKKKIVFQFTKVE